MDEIDNKNLSDLNTKFDYNIEETHKNVYKSRLSPRISMPASFDNKFSRLSLSKS